MKQYIRKKRLKPRFLTKRRIILFAFMFGIPHRRIPLFAYLEIHDSPVYLLVKAKGRTAIQLDREGIQGKDASAVFTLLPH